MANTNIQPNPNNPRTITKEEFERLKNKISRNPDGLKANKIVHENGKIIAGNQRFRALQELGLEIKDEYLLDASGWTKEQIREYLIISNVSDGEWDWDMLANEWDADELIEWGVDMPEEWGTPKETPEDIDEIPIPPKTPISKLGDLWLLGNHRVLCGDSTDKTTIERLMDGKKADMVFTDPPYNIDYSDMTGKFKKIQNDKLSDDDFKQFLIDSLTSEAKTYYVCCSWQYSHIFRTAMEAIGRPIKAFIVWNKVNPAQNLDKYYKAHEIILYSGDFGGQKTLRSDVWEFKRQKNTDHPTMKPVGLVAMALEDTRDADLIYDAFLGSGSTLIACEQTNRTCYGLELDPQYVDVICKRWQTLTGQQPILEATGEPYDFCS